jgi:8-oxo-dGTP pyrophosphatase MutT (NUDIX family)
MPKTQPVITSAGENKRIFAASAVALQALIVNQKEELLLLSSPVRDQGWQMVSGGLDAEETLLDGIRREIREELGEGIRVRPLGVIHAETFHYDQNVRYMIGIYFLFAYRGGPIVPGDDMAGSEYQWWNVSEFEKLKARSHPTAKPWMMRRAVKLYRLWLNESDQPLQAKIE